VDALLLHREREVFIGGLWHITGFDQKPMPINKLSRGQSSYSFKKKIALFINSITSFSNLPLIGIFYFGLFIVFIAGIYISLLIFKSLVWGITVMGWTSLIASIWFIGGLIIMFLGVIGLYLSKIFNETKQRPYTIIKKVYRADDA
jgi:putative glycosyltransferase